MTKDEAFKTWWHNEGSQAPHRHHDCEEHTMRMCEIAWANGAYKEREALAQHDSVQAKPEPQEERNFCPRCGKRAGKNAWDVHTCSLLEQEPPPEYQSTADKSKLEKVPAKGTLLAQPEQDEKFCDANCVWTDHHPDCKLAQLDQEPVAVYGYCPQCGAKGVMRERRPNGNDKCANGHTYPSSTAIPPQRKPLTDEQILSITRDHYNPHQRPEISFARAIEAAHGIKEKNT